MRPTLKYLVMYWSIVYVNRHNIICHKNCSRIHVVLTVTETNVKRFL
jgi:hypothetical protein